MAEGFTKEVLSLEKEMISWRRHLHEYPELSFREFRTTEFIVKKLQEFGGYAITRPCRTGVVASVKGTKPGKRHSVGIRADIDALPIREETGLPYASRTEGVMHACGHDGHTAILLAVAKILAGSRKLFCGEVRLIFQEAEELPPGGAMDLKKAGADKGLDAMLGLHLSSAFDTAVFGIRSGVLTSAVDRFDIKVCGKGGHCAYPELCADPVVTAAEIITGIQTVVSRNVRATDPAVISVCEVHGGTAYNIIPDTVNLTASVRTFGEETRTLVEREVKRKARETAKANGCTAKVKWEAGYPSVVNDEAMTETARKVIGLRFGEQHSLKIDPIMPGEDFSYFTDDKPGFFAELGTRNIRKHTDKPHHNSCYRMDETALKYGVQYFTDMVYTLLDGTGKNMPAGR